MDRRGEKYGHWTIIGDYYKKDYHKLYLCKCDCEKGTERYVDLQNLKSGKSVSCGCVRKEVTKERMQTHGESKTRLYHLWLGMRKRCNDPNDRRYVDYGGRGIKVCSEWDNSYEAYREWALSNGYDESLPWTKCSIDRIDNDKGYSPDNCRWVDVKQQANNKRNNIRIEHNGVTKTVAEWGEELGIKPQTIWARYRKGKIDTLFNKNNHDVILDYNGESHTIAEWSKITGINKQTISARNKAGHPIEDVLFVGNLVKKGR